jgi:hypothetical protein
VTFEEYTRHIDWSLTVGRRRTRQTARQAASTMREFEGAQALLEATEAVDDPLQMARSLLAGNAVDGIANAVDREHSEVVTTNRARPRAAEASPSLRVRRNSPGRVSPLTRVTIWPSPGVAGGTRYAVDLCELSTGIGCYGSWPVDVGSPFGSPTS